MAALQRMIESCLLVAMGGFMAVLSQSSLYWQFLNPQYSLLTLVSGIILLIIGFVCLFHTERKRKVSEFVGVVVFLVLAGTAITTFEYGGEPTQHAGSLNMEYNDDGSPTITVAGQEYVKINLAELLNAEPQGKIVAGQAYAIQGAVVRSDELDRAGYIALGRLVISCCFADSTAAVSLVKVDDPSLYVAGSWVRVLGVTEEQTPFPGKTITLSGALVGSRSERFVLRANEVSEQPVQGVPFVFEIREEQPFAY